MADITWDDVTTHYAALSSVPAGARVDLLTFVNDEALEASVFGGEDAVRYKLARVHYVAHIVEVAKRGGAGGPIASKTIAAESLAISYSSTPSADQLLTTAGGSALWQLLRMSPRARLFVPGSRC